MSSPEVKPFLEANSCSSCPIGQYGSALANDDTDCQMCPDGKSSNLESTGISSCKDSCLSTQVTNSNKAESNSITGVVGTSVTVTCDTGWSGTKATVCGSNLQWSPIVKCTVAKNCAATHVSNSDKSDADSITGM